MRLGYIANIRLPTEKAHGLQIMKMCEAFTKAGAETELIVPRRFNSLKRDPFVFYGVAPTFRIWKVWCLDALRLPFWKAAGFLFESMSFAVPVLVSFFSRRYELFYTRDLAIATLASFARAPLFYEVHTVPVRVTVFHRLAWRKAKGIVVISGGIERELVRLGVPGGKIIVASDAVDLAAFRGVRSKAECRHELGLPQDKRLVVYTGHLYPWKGAHLLAEAARMLSPGVEVYIVGGTESDLRAFRARFSAPNLHIIGWQEPRMIPLWLRAADLLVLPTSGKEAIGRTYTSPLKLFEYMASGTPIIAADVPAIREVLTLHEAMFFSADDSASLASTISKACEDTESLSGLAASAKNKVLAFTWEKRGKLVLDYIVGLR